MTKYEELCAQIAKYPKVAIAYSGGCDSNFLLHVCLNVLGKDNVLPVFVRGAMVTQEDLDEALGYLEGLDHVVIDMDVFSIPQFEYNDKKRCYWCKKSIMSEIKRVAFQHGITDVLDGQNVDDLSEYRPGSKACRELSILSPLADVKMTKDEIRAYSKELNIPTFDKPANACLASRFEYGTHLTRKKLERIDRAEKILHDCGIRHVRVRDMALAARIECEPGDMDKMIGQRERIVKAFRQLGFRYVTLDLNGITSGGFDKNGYIV